MRDMWKVLVILAVTATTCSAWWEGPIEDSSPHAAWLRTALGRTSSAPGVIINFEAAGGKANDGAASAAQYNGDLLRRLLLQANSTASSCDNCTKATVWVPPNMTIWVLPPATAPMMEHLDNVALRIDGIVNAFNGSHALWPVQSPGGRVWSLIDIRHCTDVQLLGTGTVDGHGYRWWVDVFNGATDNRPHLLRVESCRRVVLDGWTLRNSPMYHVKWFDVLVGVVQHVKVHVDVVAQRQILMSRHGWGLTLDRLHNPHRREYRKPLPPHRPTLTLDLPTFPLNTDGIDVRGQWIVVQHCHVENFDDSLCVKPMHRNARYLTSCSENIYIAHSTIRLGVGATVGSVPPSVNISCVRNVTFFNITAHVPIKGIYVKPNPGNNGRGIVDRVQYVNYTGINPLWWSIWVSTQQQAQPHGGANTHCSFFYPLPGQECQTQPLVPVTRLRLRNVVFKDALLSPGVLRCNASGPCTGWEWDNVQSSSMTGWPLGGNNYLCAALEGSRFVGVNAPCINVSATAFLGSGEDHRVFHAANQFLSRLWRRFGLEVGRN